VKIGKIFDWNYGFFVAPILECGSVFVEQFFQVRRLVICNPIVED
jgi:hypothetical protein